MNLLAWFGMLFVLTVGGVESASGQQAETLPIARFLVDTGAINWYVGSALYIPIEVSTDSGGTMSASTGEIKEFDGEQYLVLHTPFLGDVELMLSAVDAAGRMVTDTKMLRVSRPQLSEPPRELPFNQASVGARYCPETRWELEDIPQSHYQTIVRFDGLEVFNAEGTIFAEKKLPEDLYLTDSVKQILVTVWWRPGGTDATELWVPILTTDPAITPVIAEYKFGPVTPES